MNEDSKEINATPERPSLFAGFKAGLKRIKYKIFDRLFKLSQKKITLAVENDDTMTLAMLFDERRDNFCFVNKRKETLLHIAAHAGNIEAVA